MGWIGKTRLGGLDVEVMSDRREGDLDEVDVELQRGLEG